MLCQQVLKRTQRSQKGVSTGVTQADALLLLLAIDCRRRERAADAEDFVARCCSTLPPSSASERHAGTGARRSVAGAAEQAPGPYVARCG